MKTIIIILCCLFTVNILAAPGDVLYVKSNIINMREGPSTEFPVVLKLQKGRKLIEIQSVDGWIEVDTSRSDIRSGWIYESLLQLTPVENVQKTEATSNSAEVVNIKIDSIYELFKVAFNEFSEQIANKTGYICFTNSKDLGLGTIQVVGTEAWLALPRKEREQTLVQIFDLWDAAVGDGLPITVFIVDNKGDKQMSMMR